VKFCGNSPQKGGLDHQKGGRSKEKRGSCQMYDTEGPYQDFLWYRLGKYQENTNRYHTKIPNWDTTLKILLVAIVFGSAQTRQYKTAISAENTMPVFERNTTLCTTT
jgi:hypothetical protein